MPDLFADDFDAPEVLERAHAHAGVSMPLEDALATPSMRICLRNLAAALARRAQAGRPARPRPLHAQQSEECAA
jgi:hypothetical protein